MKNKKKGFTLIELIAVLVIMAIIALIVTPLVMSIIRKAKVSADKRSIDAYGRSIELAIAGYLLDNGTFPTSIDQLTIEYSGDEVICSTTQLNPDSSVYLAGCTVGSRSIDYEYGSDKLPSYDAYNIGDEVTYNGVDYYVIKDSGTKEQTVTLLKAEPLTVAEVNLYGGVGTTNNHVNMYATDDLNAAYYQKAYNMNGYGGMQYYSSSSCLRVGDKSNCKNDYDLSAVKYVVDAWAQDKVPNGLKEARLISYEDLSINLGYDESTKQCTGSCWNDKNDDISTWLYGFSDWYWTMSTYEDLSDSVWVVHRDGNLGSYKVYAYQPYGSFGVVRPVITLSKSAL